MHPSELKSARLSKLRNLESGNILDYIFITLIGIVFGYFIVLKAIKSAIGLVVICCVLYLLLTQRIEGGEPIINQIKALF